MWAEELTRPYGTGAADRRPSLQASRLLLQSEGSLKLENFSEAVRLAEQSLSAFRQFGDTRGQADAARLLSVAMIHQDRRKEADRLLKDELAVFQTSANSGSKSAEARLLLALADVNSDRRGQKKREEALRFVGQARTLSLDEADVGLQASSLAVMAKIFIKYKGDPKACNKEALRLGTQALQLYEQSDDSRGRAISSHHCAIAQGNLGEIAASLQYINDSASFWRKAQDLIMEANAQLMMGGLLLKGGTARQAVSAAESALASYRNCHVTGSRELRAVQLAVRAHIGNGEPWRAIWTAEDAVARYRERRDRPNEAQALLSLASGYTFSPSGREEQEDSQRHFEDPTFCPGEAGWHCWFQHITWCKPKGDVLKIYGFPEHGGFKGKDVPEVFHPLLKCSPVKPRFWFYWWRAQSIAYLIRFNEKTRSALDQLRSETLFQCKEHVKAKLLEPGTVSAHVRHGFKLWEAKIFDFEDYVEQMDALAAGNQNLRILYKEVAESNTSFSFPSDAFLRRAVFLSTEDPLVVLEVDSSHATSSSLHSFPPPRKHAVFYNLYVGTLDNVWRVSKIAREQLSLVDPQWHQLHIYSVGVVKDAWTLGIDDMQIVKEGVFVHLPEGQESSTLQELWSYCSSNSTPSEVVVYLHSKGSYHDKPAQAGWRQYLQTGALSDQCRLMPTSCDTCGSRMSPLPFPHVPGNMWAARCSYVSKLIQPKEFQSAMEQVFEERDGGKETRCPPRGGEADNCYGMGRFSSEHWVLSHPSARPCDLDSNPKYAWGEPKDEAGLAVMSSFVQNLKEVQRLQPAPHGSIPAYRVYPDCQTCGEDISERINSYRVLYHEEPPPSWWGWKFFRS